MENKFKKTKQHKIRNKLCVVSSSEAAWDLEQIYTDIDTYDHHGITVDSGLDQRALWQGPGLLSNQYKPERNFSTAGNPFLPLVEMDYHSSSKVTKS